MTTCCICGCKIAGEVVWAEGDKPFCEDCAEDELEECAYCGDRRYPENLERYCNTESEWNGKRMCIGCMEEIE
jgi:hypothetical protein